MTGAAATVKRRWGVRRRAAAVLVVLGLSALASCSDDAPDGDIPREPFPRIEESAP